MTPVVFLAALIVATGASVAIAASHAAGTAPDGSSAHVDQYKGGTFRLRVRPPQGQAAFEVTDVVVAPEVGTPAGACANDQCTYESANSVLEVRLSKEQGHIFDVDFYYKSDATGKVPVTSGRLAREPDGKVNGHFRFPAAEKLYGIPERAIDLALKDNHGYRLYNLDVFQYKLDDTKGIYGTIPFLMAHGAALGATSGLLWLNGADTNVNVNREAETPTAQWGSESGIHDIFFFVGPTPHEVQRNHAHVVGPSMMPPLFSLGYHQCRWNYRSSNDCLEVDQGFDTHNIPYDVLWLDIEHTDGKRYFTWDKYNFPDPKALIDAVAAKGRKMVTITDPHIKRDDNYHVHSQATQQGYYVKTEAGADYEGHCWPGTSSWIDFYNANARKWYATLFKYDSYLGSTPDLYSWIDMNEPSVFNSHEVTMDKNAVHQNADGTKWKHRDLHNMYGYYHTMAAYEGHLLRSSGAPHDKPTRPFILTRSFFSGSQRYAAMWTGDNMADWGHLQKSIPMLLTLSVANYIFVGADVGGFFNNPDSELLVRWYQAAAFYPFYRGHAHLETKRREPWLFGDDATRRIRDAISLRYSLLPYTYTLFFRAHDQGATVIRPLFYEWPRQGQFLEEQRAFMFGPAMLVRPITEAGQSSVTVPLPAEGERWFRFPTGEEMKQDQGHVTLAVDLDSIPMFLRGGHIIAARHRLRRSTAAMSGDPITLYVAAASGASSSTGELYLDDAHSYDFQKGGYVLRKFAFDGKSLTSSGQQATSAAAIDKSLFSTGVTVERVVFFGLAKAPTAVTVAGKTIDFSVEANGVVVLRKPALDVSANWDVKMAF